MRLPRRRINHGSSAQPHAADLINHLSQPMAAPDLTRSIMGRLGYMKVPARVARRERVRRWCNRAGMAMAMAVAIGVGLWFYQASDQVRRADHTTFPEALERDLDRQQQRMGNMIQTIRNLSTPRMEATPAPPVEPIQVEPIPAEPLPVEPMVPSREDLNRFPGLPTRWV